MKLIFDIIKNGSDTPSQRKYQFDMMNGNIGRSEGSDWTLTDSNNYISSKHVLVEFKDGIYFIKDVSTNGTFLKNPYKRLPKNISIKINSTDIFIIGEYEIQARFINNEYSQDDIISEDNNLSNKNIHEVQKINQLIPNDDDFLDDFILEDSNIMNSSFIIPDEEDYDSSFGSNLNNNDNIDLNPKNSIEATILDTEVVKGDTNVNPLNEHINIHNFEEVPIEIEDTPTKKVEEKINNTILSAKHNQDISILEKKLGIELNSLSEDQKDYILNEISDIVLNCLDGLKNSLSVKEKIRKDLQISNNSPSYNISNPILMGQHALNLLNDKDANELKLSEAVKKSFSELDTHNIALHRSSKNLINIAVMKFSPKSLEHHFETNGELNNLMPKKYQMWDSYINMFKKLNDEPDFGINLIEKDFAKEYNNISYSIKLKSI